MNKVPNTLLKNASELFFIYYRTAVYVDFGGNIFCLGSVAARHSDVQVLSRWTLSYN